MEKEINELKQKFLSGISEKKDLDYFRNFAKEIRKKINYKIEEYRETDEEFDARLFYLEKRFFEEIFSFSYGIHQFQDMKELKELYEILMRYLEMDKEINFYAKSIKDSI